MNKIYEQIKSIELVTITKEVCVRIGKLSCQKTQKKLYKNPKTVFWKVSNRNIKGDDISHRFVMKKNVKICSSNR